MLVRRHASYVPAFIAGVLVAAAPAHAAQTKAFVHSHYNDHGTAVPATDFTCPDRSDAVGDQALRSGPFAIGVDSSDNWVGTATVKVCI